MARFHVLIFTKCWQFTEFLHDFLMKYHCIAAGGSPSLRIPMEGSAACSDASPSGTVAKGSTDTRPEGGIFTGRATSWFFSVCFLFVKHHCFAWRANQWASKPIELLYFVPFSNSLILVLDRVDGLFQLTRRVGALQGPSTPTMYLRYFLNYRNTRTLPYMPHSAHKFKHIVKTDSANLDCW